MEASRVSLDWQMPSGETRMVRKGVLPMATAYINGKIYTMKAEGDLCSAIVVEDGKFLYCGTDEEAKRIAEGGEVVDLHQAPVAAGRSIPISTCSPMPGTASS